MSNVSHARLQLRFSWNLISCCVSRRHGQRSNVLAVFIFLSWSKTCPCFAIGPELRANEVGALQTSIRRDRLYFFWRLFRQYKEHKGGYPLQTVYQLEEYNVWNRRSFPHLKTNLETRVVWGLNISPLLFILNALVCLARRRTGSCLKMSQACCVQASYFEWQQFKQLSQ